MDPSPFEALMKLAELREKVKKLEGTGPPVAFTMFNCALDPLHQKEKSLLQLLSDSEDAQSEAQQSSLGLRANVVSIQPSRALYYPI